MCRRIVRMCNDRSPLQLGQGQSLNDKYKESVNISVHMLLLT